MRFDLSWERAFLPTTVWVFIIGGKEYQLTGEDLAQLIKNSVPIWRST